MITLSLYVVRTELHDDTKLDPLIYKTSEEATTAVDALRAGRNVRKCESWLSAVTMSEEEAKHYK